jgi:hypothetical protein
MEMVMLANIRKYIHICKTGLLEVADDEFEINAIQIMESKNMNP